MYKAYGHVRSRALRVVWMLEELGQPYDYINHRPASDAMKAVNASGKAPALDVDGTLLTDSCAIMSYLADAHGQLTYAAGTLERARQDALIHQINDELDAVLWMAGRHSFVLPEEHRLPQIKDSLRWEFARNCDRIAAEIQGEFLMGDRFTVPDILLTHCMNWAVGAKFSCENRELMAYAKRMRQRPAYKRAFALES